MTKSDLASIREALVGATVEVLNAWEANAQTGRRLRLARERAGLSQLELAERLGVRLETVSEREWHLTHQVSPGYVERVLVACDLPSDWEAPPDTERERQFKENIDGLLARHTEALRRLAE